MVRRKPVVIVTRKLPEVIETRMMELFEARLNHSDKPWSKAELIEAVKTAEILVPTVTDRITSSVLAHANPDLRLIANYGTGVDHIDVEAAYARGITVTNTPGVLTEDTADMSMALILAVARRLVEGERLARSGEWSGWSPTSMLGHRITGKRLGILGMGRIGSAVARRARGFGLAIHYHNRRRVPGAARERARGDLLGEPRPDGGAHGHHQRQLPPHPGDLPPALGAPAQAAAARGDHRQHLARRGHRRGGAGAHAAQQGDRRRRARRVRARAGDQSRNCASSTTSCCCRTWARRPSRAGSTWARRW